MGPTSNQVAKHASEEEVKGGCSHARRDDALLLLLHDCGLMGFADHGSSRKQLQDFGRDFGKKSRGG